MSDVNSEKPNPETSSKDSQTLSDRDWQCREKMEEVVGKLKGDAGSITIEDDSSLRQAPQTSLLTAAKDIHIAVESKPHEVTTEVLRATQSIVSKMQKAVGHTNAPHPEVEAELQEEIARIEPKITQGTVTKAEADHLHSLEARAHGHTQKGGITAAAQSVVARRERQMSLSNGSSSSSSVGRSRASSKAFAFPPQESGTRKEESTPTAQEDAEKRTHGHSRKGRLDATAQSFVSAHSQVPSKPQDSLSDMSNASFGVLDAESDYYREQSHHAAQLSQKLAELTTEPKGKEGAVSYPHKNSQSSIEAR